MKRKLKNRGLAGLLCILLLLALTAGCGQVKTEKPEAPAAVTVTDWAGRSVEVPASPQSICCICPFSGAIIVMMGAGDAITTSCNNMIRSKLLTAICPNIGETVVVKSSSAINTETILEKQTDLIFIPSDTYDNPDQRALLEALGIPYIVVGFDGLESQLAAIELIGEALGNREKAQQYTAYCRETYERVRKAAASYTGTPVRLYHSINEAVRTDTPGSICAELIELTGAENVSLTGELSIDGSKAYATLEQIYLWDPDLIICNEAGVDDYILSDDKWSGLRCVGEGKVYQMPVGIARMGHPAATENPLAALWLGQLLYPDLLSCDFKEELKRYYLTFYDYEISDDIAQAILDADDMRIVMAGQKAA